MPRIQVWCLIYKKNHIGDIAPILEEYFSVDYQIKANRWGENNILLGNKIDKIYRIGTY